MTSKFTLLICFCMAFSGSAFAACGGGGYTAQQRTDRTEVRQDSSANSSAPDFSQLDKVSGTLNLTPSQSRDIKTMEADVRTRYERAQSRSQTFDVKRDFEVHLAMILTPDQMRAYWKSGEEPPRVR